MSFLYRTGHIKPASSLIDEDALRENGTDGKYIVMAKEGKINPWLLHAGRLKKNYLLDNVLLESEENMEAWRYIRSLLGGMRESCDRMGARLMIVIFPRSVQVNESHFDFWKKLTFNLDKRTLTERKPQDLILEFCTDTNTPCLDLLPAFKESRDELFLENDDHLNEKGSILAANLIRHFLMESMEN